MLLNVSAAVVLAAVALNMAMKERGTVSHRMAWIPAVMAVMEVVMCGVLSLWDFPLLTVLLMASRLTVLGCCSVALKRDAAAERNRRRRRAVWRRVAADLQRDVQASNVVPLHRCA